MTNTVLVKFSTAFDQTVNMFLWDQRFSFRNEAGTNHWWSFGEDWQLWPLPNRSESLCQSDLWALVGLYRAYNDVYCKWARMEVCEQIYMSVQQNDAPGRQALHSEMQNSQGRLDIRRWLHINRDWGDVMHSCMGRMPQREWKTTPS